MPNILQTKQWFISFDGLYTYAKINKIIPSKIQNRITDVRLFIVVRSLL